VKLFPPDAQAEIEKGTAVTPAAVAILCDPPVRVWRGYGQIEIDGETFDGIGDVGLVSATGGALGGAEQSITLELSGVEPATLALFDASTLRRAPCVIYNLIFDGSGTQLLHAEVFARGSLDQIPVEDVPGGTATIRAMVETAARGLGRHGGRMRTDTDQRLIKANDGGFKAIAYAGQKNLYWGGKKPAIAGTALGGTARARWGGA
jgi:hypothetical protein